VEDLQIFHFYLVTLFWHGSGEPRQLD